jgi:1-acyl-sn-glycerol-3-phosphate acyltransferase
MITVRSLLFNVTFFLVSFFLTVPAYAVRLASPGHVMPMAILWARLLVAAARIICGIRLEVEGLENIPPGAALIASGHQSAFDTFVWLTLLPRCCYVLKHELLRIPLFGGLITATRMIAVDRSAGASAIRALLREGDRAVREERQIVIFPEGTRSEPGRPRPLQPGVLALAARTGLPVVPVATNSGTCWGRKAFTKRPGTIRIVIGAPLPPRMPRADLLRALEDRLGGLEAAAPAVAPIR